MSDEPKPRKFNLWPTGDFGTFLGIALLVVACGHACSQPGCMELEGGKCDLPHVEDAP